MPTFSTLPLSKARANSATGHRAALLQEYVAYIQRVAPGEAGKLELGEGETTQAVRRRLNVAAEALGMDLKASRSTNAVYFWVLNNRHGADSGKVSKTARNKAAHFHALGGASSSTESSTQQKVRPEVMAHYRASLARNRLLAELLAQ